MAGAEPEIAAWFTARLPGDWYAGPPEITADGEEILVTGPLAEPQVPADAGPAARQAALEARVARFREETRDRRVAIAHEAERRFGRKVAWGASAGEVARVFTSLSVPVMTRLRQPERRVLDTLVEAGVARSRSDALAWCVRLVGRHQAEWITELQKALRLVDEVRGQGPR